MVLLFMVCTSEDGCDSSSSNVQTQEQNTVEANQQALMTATPTPVLTKSLERINIVNRLNLFEDENKVSYIYLISFGKVMSFYTVKGKVTSGNKRLTTDQKIVENNPYSGTYDYSVVESPSLDGTYGTSGDYIYFWTTDGTYVQWNDAYMLCDKPLKMETQPDLTLEVK